MQINTKFGKAVYHAREQQGLTQKQVAEAISVSVRWYQRVENGEKMPGTIVTLRLILLLHIDVERFRDELRITLPQKKEPAAGASGGK